VGLFAQVMPAGLGHFDAIVFCRSFDVCEGLVALVVGDVLDLIETSDGVANVGRVVEGLLTFVGEGVDGGGEFVALLGVERFVVFVMLPGCIHDGLQSCFRSRRRTGVLRKLGCDL
jgi:hypothetical protein